MIEELKKQIELKIAETSLQSYPFPHLIIENFFPSEIFSKILEYNPFKKNVGQEWVTKQKSEDLKTNTPYFARKQINFHTEQLFLANEAEGFFWNQIKDCFFKDYWFEKLIINKYKEYFIIRFGEIVESEQFFPLFKRELFLQRHDPGYFLGPHTDVPTRVFTCIFSFADREGFDNYGTQLCVPKDPLIRCWGNGHHSPEDFEVRKIAPYKPNSFLLFFKTRQSFHAVPPIDETVPNQRYGMQFQYYEPRRGVLKDISEPDLLISKHNKRSGEKNGSKNTQTPQKTKIKNFVKRILTNQK